MHIAPHLPKASGNVEAKKGKLIDSPDEFSGKYERSGTCTGHGRAYEWTCSVCGCTSHAHDAIGDLTLKALGVLLGGLREVLNILVEEFCDLLDVVVAEDWHQSATRIHHMLREQPQVLRKVSIGVEGGNGGAWRRRMAAAAHGGDAWRRRMAATSRGTSKYARMYMAPDPRRRA